MTISSHLVQFIGVTLFEPSGVDFHIIVVEAIFIVSKIQCLYPHWETFFGGRECYMISIWFVDGKI